jgi:hypothetical protein
MALTRVGAGPRFDEFERHLAGVGETVGDAQRDEVQTRTKAACETDANTRFHSNSDKSVGGFYMQSQPP